MHYVLKLLQKQLQMAREDSSREAEGRLNPHVPPCRGVRTDSRTESCCSLHSISEFRRKKKKPADVVHMCYILNDARSALLFEDGPKDGVGLEAFSEYKTMVGVEAGSHDKPDSNIFYMIY